MDSSSTKLFTMLKNRMAYLSQRQSVLARNIANADTPGYKPQDLKKVDFRKMANSATRDTGLKITHPGHINPLSTSGKFATEKQEGAFEVKPSGNEVAVEEQMLKIAENSLDYQTTTSIYKKMNDMMRNALGQGR